MTKWKCSACGVRGLNGDRRYYAALAGRTVAFDVSDGRFSFLPPAMPE
jgi:hypothetical protein